MRGRFVTGRLGFGYRRRELESMRERLSCSRCMSLEKDLSMLELYISHRESSGETLARVSESAKALRTVFE